MASEQVPKGIYAVEKGNYAELRCDHCTSVTQIKTLTRQFSEHTHTVTKPLDPGTGYEHAALQGIFYVFACAGSNSNHMQYQIRDPKGFAEMLASIAAHDGIPKLPFIRKCEDPI